MTRLQRKHAARSAAISNVAAWCRPKSGLRRPLNIIQRDMDRHSENYLSSSQGSEEEKLNQFLMSMEHGEYLVAEKANDWFMCITEDTRYGKRLVCYAPPETLELLRDIMPVVMKGITMKVKRRYYDI